MIKERLEEVRKNIAAACARSGRDPGSVTLIAVSKTKPVALIREAMNENVIDFGENKPQELREKCDILGTGPRWHMIGHLQRNKVKYVVGRACMIHSVDSVRLAREVSDEAVRKGIVLPVLAEVNIAGEDTKFGLKADETEEAVREMALLPGIRICGLMTIAPYVKDPEENRVHFRNLRNLSIDIGYKNIDNVNMCELSMGMTGDYEVAIEEGATFVRVGTGIFGERDYTV